MKLYARTHGVHEVAVGATGHRHRDLESAPDGLPRLVIDCTVCQPFLHPVDFSVNPNDVVLTYDEEKHLVAAQEREKRLSPEIAEIVARVVAGMHDHRERLEPQEDAIVAAVRAELAKPASVGTE